MDGEMELSRELDLQVMVLGLAVSALLRKSRITPKELQDEFTAYMSLLPPEERFGCQAMKFCMDSLAELADPDGSYIAANSTSVGIGV